MALSLSIGTSQLSQSVSGNYTTLRVNVNIRWTSGSWDHNGYTKYVTIDGSTYYFSSEKVNPNRTSSGSQTLYSVDVNIPHNSDGTKSVSIYAYVKTASSSGTVTASASPTLSTIPRTSPATLSASSVATGGSFTVYTNRYSSSFTHTIKITLGSKAITKTGVGTSVTITIPRDWATALPNAVSGTATVVCTTDGIGSVTKNITITVNSADIPTLTKVTAKPYSSNSTVSDWETYIQGYSSVEITFNTAAGVQGSSITGYKIKYDNKEVTASPYRTPVINSSGPQKIYCYAKDSRGRWSEAKEITVDFLSYAKPSLSNAEAYRSKDTGVKDEKNGTSLSAIATAVFSSCGGKNSAALKCRRRQKDGGWMGYVSMKSGKLTTFAQGAVSITHSYEVEIKITDALGETNEVVIEIPTKAAALSFLPGGKGGAVGKVAEKEGVFEIAWDTETKGVTIKKETNPVVWLEATEDAKGRILKNVTSTGDYGTYLQDYGKNGTSSLRVVNKNDSLRSRIQLVDSPKNGSATYYNLLGTHNVADYVVEYRLSDADKWSYRKWNSGIAECWLFYYNTIEPYSSNGSTEDFKYLFVTYFDLPFTFVTNSDKNHHCGYSKTAAVTVGNGPAIAASGHLNDTPSKVCIHWASNNTGVSYINLHLMGRWK